MVFSGSLEHLNVQFPGLNLKYNKTFSWSVKHGSALVLSADMGLRLKTIHLSDATFFTAAEVSLL